MGSYFASHKVKRSDNIAAAVINIENRNQKEKKRKKLEKDNNLEDNSTDLT